MRTRRTFIRVVGAAGVVGLAGCNGDDGTEDSDEDSSESEDPTETGTAGETGNSGSSSSANWLSIDGNPRNTSSNTAMSGPTSEPETNDLYRRSGLGGRPTVPVVENGLVYIRIDENIRAFTTDGEEQWKFGLGDVDTLTPAVRDGTVFIPTQESLIAVADGERQWAVNPENALESSAVASGDGVYVAAGESVKSYTQGGETRWSVSLDDVAARPAVDGSTVYAASSGLFGGETLYALDASDGSEQWSVDHPGTSAIPVVADGTLFFVSGGNESVVMAVSGEDGSVRWESEPISGPVESRPAVADGVVYQAIGNEVHAFDAEDGSAVWDSPYVATGEILDQPRVDGNSVYLHQDGNIIAIDRETGDQRWSKAFKSDGIWNYAGFSVADGSIYVGEEYLHKLG